MGHGLISIVVPVYNAAVYLEPFAKSLARQTSQDYEVLFVNDHSPDNSGAILDRLARKDSRIKHIEHPTNRGAGAARNTGLDNATGEYIAYIDADDSVEPNYLERMRDTIEKDQSDIAVCNSIWEFVYKPFKKNVFLAKPNTTHAIFTGRELLRRYYHAYEVDLWVPPEPWAKIVRRSFIEKHRMRFRETLHEDNVMTFEELLNAQRVSFIGDYLYHYNRTNENAITVERRKEYIRDLYRTPEGIFAVMEKYGVTDQMRAYATMFFFTFIDGQYTYFSKGAYLREDMRYAVEKYRGLLKQPQSDDHVARLLCHVRNLQNEMSQYGFSDLFSLFIEPHREWLEGLGVGEEQSGKHVVKRAIQTLMRVPKSAFRRITGRAA